jgi:hypothetical protein
MWGVEMLHRATRRIKPIRASLCIAADCESTKDSLTAVLLKSRVAYRSQDIKAIELGKKHFILRTRGFFRYAIECREMDDKTILTVFSQIIWIQFAPLLVLVAAAVFYLTVFGQGTGMPYWRIILPALFLYSLIAELRKRERSMDRIVSCVTDRFGGAVKYE